jgi:hypothetical protein
MKKLIATCTVAVGLFAAANSFGIPATTGPVFQITSLSGTVTYDPVAPYTTSYKNLSSTTSPTLISKTFKIADLIKLLNRSYDATNIIYDVTGLWQIPSDAILVYTPYVEFGNGTNLFDGFGDSSDNNAGHLAFVNASGFYFPLQGTDYSVNPNPVYLLPGGDYSLANLVVFDVVGNSVVSDATNSFGQGTETDIAGFYFQFDDYNVSLNGGSTIQQNAFLISGTLNLAFASTAIAAADPNQITDVTISGGGSFTTDEDIYDFADVYVQGSLDLGAGGVAYPNGVALWNVGGNDRLNGSITFGNYIEAENAEQAFFTSGEFFPAGPGFVFGNWQQ